MQNARFQMPGRFSERAIDQQSRRDAFRQKTEATFDISTNRFHVAHFTLTGTPKSKPESCSPGCLPSPKTETSGKRPLHVRFGEDKTTDLSRGSHRNIET